MVKLYAECEYFLVISHNADYVARFTISEWVSFFCAQNWDSDYKAHIFHLAFVLCSGGYDIYPRGGYIAVTENIRKLGDILFQTVKGPCKQMAQVVGKHFFGVYSRACAQFFHLCPDVASV